MPKAQLSTGIEMHYEIDDYTDPWKKPATVLMLHGNLECSASWYAWVPVLARHFRVVRPDMRGYGQSTPPVPADYPWTIDVPIDDFIKLMDQLGIDKFHLIAAKIGGFIARRLISRPRVEPDGNRHAAADLRHRRARGIADQRHFRKRHRTVGAAHHERPPRQKLFA